MSNSNSINNEAGWFFRRLHQSQFKTIDIPMEGSIQFMRDSPMSCIQLNSVDYRHVSRTHCTVECVNGQLVLTDVSSSTGTYVNNRMFSRNAPGSVSLEEGDVIGIGCPTMGEDSYYQIQTHALLFRVCRKRERIPTVKTEDDVIEISDDESVGESFKPSSAAPTTLEQKVEECEQPHEPSLPPLLHAKDETGSRSPIKVELPYQSDTEINGIPLPPLQKKPDTPMSENSDDSVVVVLDDEYTDQHYSQMVLENIKTESVDVPDEGQDANDCDDVLRTSGEWFSKLNNTVEWPFGRPDRQAILCDPKPMRKRRCSVIDNEIEPSGTTAGVSRQPFPSESPCKPVPKRRFSVVEAEKIVKQKMKRRASVSDRSMGTKKKEYQKQIARKLQEVAAKESAQKSLEARHLIGAQQKTGITLPRVKSTPNRGDFLMDPIATCSKKAPAKDTVSRPSYEDGIVCTQSTTLEELPCLDEVVENRSDSWIPGVRYPKKLTFQSVEQLKTGSFKIPKLTPTYAPKTLPTNVSLAATGCAKNASVRTTRSIQTSIATATVSGKRGVKSALSDVTNRAGRIKKNVSFNEKLNVTHTVGRWIGAVQSERLPHHAYQYRTARSCTEDKEIGCILRWDIDWLEASDASTCQPATCVGQLQEKYSKLSELYGVMYPLMQLELRQDMCNQYKISSRLWYVQLVDVKVGENSFKEVHCEVHNKGRNDMPLSTVGVIGILDYPTRDGQRIRCFGYIIRNIKPCFNGSNNNSAGTSFQRYTCQMKVFSDQLAMEVHHDNSITFRPITTISPHIRQVLGLCMLQHSHILPIILDPEQNREQVVVPGNGFKKHIKVRKEILARIPPNALNEGQMNVMLSVLEECCLGESPSVSLIQGPPGTGKSRVISQLALEIWRFRRPGMKVMICAQSNTAVDVIALKLFNLRNDLAEGHRFNLVRIGTWDKIDPSCRSIFLEQLAYQKMQDKRLLPNDGHIKLEEVQRRLSSLKCDARRDFESTKRDIIEKADIVCSTLGSCHAVGTLCEAIIFDVCIIDEATQCTEPCSLVPLQYDMTKLVLVGDIKQLRATVLANKSMQAGLCDSLFSRMYNWFHKANLSAGIKTLNVQYRMHPEICSWPNNYFYEGRLISHSTAAAGGKLPLLPYVVLSLCFDQELTQIQHQIYNRDELVFVVKLLKQVLKYCRKDTSVAIITPYQRHKSEMVYELKRNQLQQITVHSIDSVQGKEFDVVFVSLARSIGTGFLNSGERINVALTRARHSLILCGNFGSLVTTPVWSALLKDAEERKVLHELEGSCADTDVNSIVKKLRVLPNI